MKTYSKSTKDAACIITLPYSQFLRWSEGIEPLALARATREATVVGGRRWRPGRLPAGGGAVMAVAGAC